MLVPSLPRCRLALSLSYAEYDVGSPPSSPARRIARACSRPRRQMPEAVRGRAALHTAAAGLPPVATQRRADVGGFDRR